MFFSQLVYAQTTTSWKTLTGQVRCIVDGVPTLKCLEAVFSNIILAASTLIVLVLFIMLIVGAFGYLTSAGNPERVKKAQSTLKFAIIGFILFISAYLILRVISFLFLGGSTQLFKFSIP